MKKIWINKTDSFKASEKFDLEYYLEMTGSERLETVQLLREEYYLKMNKHRNGSKNENSKGLRRIIKVIQQE